MTNLERIKQLEKVTDEIYNELSKIENQKFLDEEIKYAVETAKNYIGEASDQLWLASNTIIDIENGKNI